MSPAARRIKSLLPFCNIRSAFDFPTKILKSVPNVMSAKALVALSQFIPKLSPIYLYRHIAVATVFPANGKKGPPAPPPLESSNITRSISY